MFIRITLRHFTSTHTGLGDSQMWKRLWLHTRRRLELGVLLSDGAFFAFHFASGSVCLRWIGIPSLYLFATAFRVYPLAAAFAFLPFAFAVWDFGSL